MSLATASEIQRYPIIPLLKYDKHSFKTCKSRLESLTFINGEDLLNWRHIAKRKFPSSLAQSFTGLAVFLDLEKSFYKTYKLYDKSFSRGTFQAICTAINDISEKTDISFGTMLLNNGLLSHS